MRVRIGEETLKSVANFIHGGYFHASSGTKLKKVCSWVTRSPSAPPWRTRTRAPATSPWTAACATSAARKIGVAHALGVAQPRVALDGSNLVAALWMSVVAIGCSVPLWFASARILGITVTAIHTNLAPFYVMLMALAFGGTISGRQVVGAVLVAAGALLAQISARRQAAA
jgi:drug/metabolite transporter (DMT)-like permease